MGGILREGTWNSSILKVLAENAPTVWQTEPAQYAIISVIVSSYIGTVIYLVKSCKFKKQLSKYMYN